MAEQIEDRLGGALAPAPRARRVRGRPRGAGVDGDVPDEQALRLVILRPAAEWVPKHGPVTLPALGIGGKAGQFGDEVRQHLGTSPSSS